MNTELSRVGLRPDEDESSRVDTLKGLLSLNGLSSPLFFQIAPQLTRMCVSSMLTRV